MTTLEVITGQQAPLFTLQDTEGKPFSLKNHIGDKNIVVLFFPLAFSGVCTEEMCNVRDNMAQYDQLDAKVIGISVDSFFTLAEFKKAQNLSLPLLSDFNKEACAAYGVLNYDFFGMNGVAKRAAFVIDKSGVIQYTEILDDAGNQPDFAAIQSTLEELR